jgi:hypothetical protein
VAYLLARGDAISNWWLIVVIVAVAAAMPLLAKQFTPRPAPAPGSDGDVPLELVGIARPYTDDDRIAVDAALGLPPNGQASAPQPAGQEA